MGALCSARMLPVLRRVLGDAAEDIIPAEINALGQEERMPVEQAHGMLLASVERLRKPYLGLSVGRTLCLGESGPFDYVVRSAGTVRTAIETAGRYSSFLSDGYRIGFDTWRRRALIELFDEVSWPRPVAEMAMAGSYKLHVGERAPFTSRLECWFPYPRPHDVTEHERSFPGAVLRFDAPCYAFAFDRDFADAPQPGANPFVHEMLRERLDAWAGEMRHSLSTRRRVRRAIEEHLRQSHNATALGVAKSLHMSRRTLSRRLQSEGTTFMDELDTVRRDMALDFVRHPERSLAEVAFLLGFSHVESFHRAFKRWTGDTPRTHRFRTN